MANFEAFEKQGKVKSDAYKSMLEFIYKRQEEEFKHNVEQYPKIQRVINITTKDWDDDNGPIGKHYVVKCQMISHISGGFGGSGTYQQTENTCLVDIYEFKKFLSEKNAVIWL